MPNWIYSEEELNVILPSVTSVFNAKNAKPGDVISVAGSDLDLVDFVSMPNDEVVDFVVADGKISIVLPDNASDGMICMYPKSGVEVNIANLTMARSEGVV